MEDDFDFVCLGPKRSIKASDKTNYLAGSQLKVSQNIAKRRSGLGKVTVKMLTFSRKFYRARERDKTEKDTQSPTYRQSLLEACPLSN